MNKRASIIFISILALALGLRLFLCALPTETLIVPSLFDDSFIGLKMSRNMAQGIWISWDGQTKTNALTNPGFLVLMAPIYWAFPGRWDFCLHLILGLSALADALTIVLLYRFVSFLAGRRAGLLASLLWAFNPFVISFVLSGSEHAFESLGFIACVSYYVRTIRIGNRRTAGRFLLLGLMLGVTTMFRVSLLFLFVFTLLDAVWSAARDGSFRRTVLGLCLMAAAFALVLAPWMFYSYREFGTLLPHNAGLISYYNHNLYMLAHPGGLNWLQAEIRFVLNAFNIWFEVFGLGHLSLSNPYPIHVLGGIVFSDLVMLFRVAFILIGGAIFYSAAKGLSRGNPALSRLAPSGFAFATVFFLTLYYGGIQWKLDKRYFIEAILLFAIAVPVLGVTVLDAVWRKRRERLTVVIAAGVLILFNYSALGFHVWEKGPESVGAYSVNHRSMFRGAMWVNRNLPPGAIIGAFNPGIYGYYVDNQVVDLVGIANKEAWDAARERNLLEYIWAKKVDYILDFYTCLDFFYSPYLTGGDYRYWGFIEEGPLFAKGPITGIHLYIVKRPDGTWNGLSLKELKRRAAKDTF
ncbi:MAG: glycosyltransferase family 39 protein [Candidatus Aureabacteria bacterium]|nr:glycosyltransferase family 39 protein [Candidatus Auribacterota bacterium]